MPALPPAALNFAIYGVNPLILQKRMQWMEVVEPFKVSGARSSKSMLLKMHPVKRCSASVDQQPGFE
jgi:hypothetical protein